MADKKILLAFDFDDTITDENTCVAVIDMIANPKDRAKLDDQAKDDWNVFMNQALEVLHSNNITVEDIKSRLEEVSIVDGMAELFNHVRENESMFDCIIISNANDLFVNTVLNKHNLKSVIQTVISHKAKISGDLLQIVDCHSHDHKDCPASMCKGKLLIQYLLESRAKGIKYRLVCYCGDGTNDFCPAHQLKKKDFVFVRRGFGLDRRIARARAVNESDVKAQIVPWTNGNQILDHLLAVNASYEKANQK